MARAYLEITCDECGKTFKHTKYVRTARDRESYEEWAQKNITICPDCYRKWRVEKYIRDNKGEVVRMPYKTYKNEWVGCKTVPNSYNQSDKSIDVIITQKDRAIKAGADCIPDVKLKQFWEEMSSIIDANDERLPPVSDDAPEWFKLAVTVIQSAYYGGDNNA